MAKQSNITVDQGSDVAFSVSVEDQDGNALDLTGCTASAQIRKYYSSLNAVPFTANVNTSTKLINLTLTAIQTANITPGRYVYDVDLINTDANTTTRVTEGICTIRPSVTH